MTGFLFDDIVFGPVMSRRLGVSLGINLLPRDYKYCTFNCIYCECGWTEKQDKKLNLPTREMVVAALEDRLIQLVEMDSTPDALTFAGNGEPTIHPEFEQIVYDTVALRDKYVPDSLISVLSNASMVHKDSVRRAFGKTDRNILKLDAGTEEMFRAINKPAGGVTLAGIVENIRHFSHNLIVQTLFLRGSYNGIAIDNTGGAEFESWLGHVRQLNPQYVMAYSIDRPTPAGGLEKISFEELQHIASRIEQEGIRVKVFG
jgi:wyosine [tRNA(Phe)-imidazoG37] synthetase (radical SAM superfamily)